jgi:hypothetical protein
LQTTLVTKIKAKKKKKKKKFKVQHAWILAGLRNAHGVTG